MCKYTPCPLVLSPNVLDFGTWRLCQIVSPPSLIILIQYESQFPYIYLHNINKLCAWGRFGWNPLGRALPSIILSYNLVPTQSVTLNSSSDWDNFILPSLEWWGMLSLFAYSLPRSVCFAAPSRSCSCSCSRENAREMALSSSLRSQGFAFVITVTLASIIAPLPLSVSTGSHRNNLCFAKSK